MAQQNPIAKAIQSQTNSINRLAEAIEQNNQLVIQVLNANSALLESVLAEESGDDETPKTYLDGSSIY